MNAIPEEPYDGIVAGTEDLAWLFERDDEAAALVASAAPDERWFRRSVGGADDGPVRWSWACDRMRGQDILSWVWGPTIHFASDTTTEE